MMFNWNYYVNKYPQLFENKLNNERDALLHWLKYGKDQKLIYIDIPIYFNWKNYILSNHLSNIKCEEEAWRHFLYNGNNDHIKINHPDLKLYCI
jgi:hypothetical protein